jgi:hypothetical protein
MMKHERNVAWLLVNLLELSDYCCQTSLCLGWLEFRGGLLARSGCLLEDQYMEACRS